MKQYPVWVALIVLIVSLACMVPTVTPSARLSRPSQAALSRVLKTSVCARTVTALHLRAAPSPDAQVLDFINDGAVVRVQMAVGDWSLVTVSGGRTGFARSLYLVSMECP